MVKKKIPNNRQTKALPTQTKPPKTPTKQEKLKQNKTKIIKK